MTYEYMALNKLLTGDAELIKELNKDLFLPKAAKLYTLILEYYDKAHSLPTAELLKAEIDIKAPITVREPYKAIVDAITRTDTSIDNSILLKSMHDSLTLRSVDSKIEELLDAQREKDADKVRGLLAEITTKFTVNRVNVKSHATAFDEEDNFAVIPSGFGEEWDKLQGGGLSGVVLFGAESGGMKSVALQHPAVEAYKQGKNVLFLSLELSGKVLGNRIKAQISGVDFSKINSNNLTKQEAELVESSYKAVFKDDNTNHFRIITDPLDTEELLNIISVEHQLYGIDVVIIDYLNLVSSPRYESESWKVLSETVKRLHRLTMRYGITVLTATQVDIQKKATDAEPPEVTTRGTKELRNSATQFFFIHKVDTPDQTVDTRVLFTLKNRIAATKHVPFIAEPHIMRLTATDIVLN